MHATFMECSQEMVDANARDEEARSAKEKMSWNKIIYRRHTYPQAAGRKGRVKKERKRFNMEIWKAEK